MQHETPQNPDAARVLPDGKTYSDAEVQDIYRRAAQIQSTTTFERVADWEAETVEAGANRAGISDAALLAAIKERETALENARQDEKIAQIRGAQTRKMALIGGAILVTFAAFSLWRTSATLGPAHAQVLAGRAQIDNVLQRRHDLIPNLLAITRDVLGQQKQLIAALETANQNAKSSGDLAAQAQLSQSVNAALGALARANADAPLVLRVSDQLEGAENRIAQERRRYNEAVAQYNARAGVFPTRFWGRFLGYPAQHEFFPMDEKARQAPRY